MMIYNFLLSQINSVARHILNIIGEKTCSRQSHFLVLDSHEATKLKKLAKVVPDMWGWISLVISKFSWFDRRRIINR